MENRTNTPDHRVCFARVTEMERLEIMRVPGIYTTVSREGWPATIRKDEAEHMRLLINVTCRVGMDPLHPWTRVKVTDVGYRLGFNGLEGIVLKVLGSRVTLFLDRLHSQVSMTIQAHLLSKFSQDSFNQNQKWKS